MSLKNKLLAEGIPAPSVEHQMVGFYFTIGSFSMEQWVSADDEVSLECSRVRGALSARFESHLRALPEWTIQEHNMRVEPYEMCADNIEAEEIDGRPAFSLWLYQGDEFPLDTLKAFWRAFQDAISAVSDDTHVHRRIKPLKVVTNTTYKIVSQEEINLDI